MNEIGEPEPAGQSGDPAPVWWQRLRAWWRQRGPAMPQHPPGTANPLLPQPNAELVLRSADPYLDFTVRAHVGCSWTGSGEPHPAPMSVAKEGIARRADEISAKRTLPEAQRLRGELEVGLWEPARVADTPVLAWAHSISVEADPELAEAVRARTASLRREQVASWEQQRRREREREYEALLADPVRATSWWFADNPDRPDRLGEMATEFRRVRDVLRPEVDSGSGRDTLGAVLDDFAADADIADVKLLATQLLRIFGELGRDDLVDRVRRAAEKAAVDRGSAERSEFHRKVDQGADGSAA